MDHDTMMPEAKEIARIRDELRTVDEAMARMKGQPRYDEAALAELQVRRRELESRLDNDNGNADNG
jgi:hypothetical protein